MPAAFAAQARVQCGAVHQAQCDGDVAEVEVAAWTAMRTCPLARGASTSGQGTQVRFSSVPLVGMPRRCGPGAGGRCGGRWARLGRQAWQEDGAGAQGELVLAEGEGVRDAGQGGRVVVDVQQAEPAGVFGLGGADQAPYGRAGQGGDVLPGAGVLGQAGADDQGGGGEGLLGEEALDVAQRVSGRVAQGGERIGAEGDGVVRAQHDVCGGGPVRTSSRPVCAVVRPSAAVRWLTRPSGVPMTAYRPPVAGSAGRAGSCGGGRGGVPLQFVERLVAAAVGGVDLFGARRAEREGADAGEGAAVFVGDGHRDGAFMRPGRGGP